MGDLPQKSTGDALAQDIAYADISEQTMNDGDDTASRQEERQRLREAHSQKHPLTVERLGQKLLHNKKSTPNYEPVITMDHDWRYTKHLKTAALALANDGFFVFPCRPQDILDENGKVVKGAKAPLTKNGCYDATIDPEQITGWWHQHRRPDALIGIRTGMIGGIWVLDADIPKRREDGTMSGDGIAELKQLEAKFGPLPETYTVKTPRGGYHYYFKMPDGVTIKNDASTKVGPGIDVRGEGGHVVAPPSMMADGRKYEAIDNGFLPTDAAFAPPWLIELVTSDGSKKSFEKLDAKGWAHRILGRKCEEIVEAEEGTRNDTLNRVAFSVGGLVGEGALDRSAAHDALLDAARKCGLPEDEARKTINSGLSSGAGEKSHQPLFPDWSKSGPIKESIDNVRAMLSWMGVKLRHNQFTERAEMSGFQDYTLLNDNAWKELWAVAREYGFQPGKVFLADALEAIALQEKYHPVKEYFESLEWDGVKRLDKLFIDYAGAEDNEYVRAVSAKPLIAAVRRIYEPGTKFDTMPVIESKQGTGKSTMLQILAVRDEWFADGLSLTDSTKEVIEQVEGCLIVEIQELAGMSHADVNRVKPLISRRFDKARKAYGRFTTNLPRQFVLFATTNPGDKPAYLKDKTGNRRFWPVKIRDEPEIDFASFKRDRDQLWAEAVHRHKAGESLILPKRLWDFAKTEQQKRVAEHPWVAILEDAFEENDEPMLGKVRVEDVWRLLGKNDAPKLIYEMTDLGEAMKKLGWEHTRLRFGKKRAYCYVRGAPPYREITVSAGLGNKPIVSYAKPIPEKEEDREY
jgi:hypothetical protein